MRMTSLAADVSNAPSSDVMTHAYNSDEEEEVCGGWVHCPSAAPTSDCSPLQQQTLLGTSDTPSVGIQSDKKLFQPRQACSSAQYAVTWASASLCQHVSAWLQREPALQ